ncbi:SpoIIE family protein phosphatase [Texcoconibacillus texcoconensis]|uniref:Negative regulator of sigma-B (Phosphoserine phosphatase) n=1 Tax=Texcoconibacillus texcoconensis TaxID=1095777 RepID=A0A840QS63_9BACI|nr:SpoIIE family protein phosphatase [Texcoconibacillus texcoconensis]MBB5174205.1 negative regulator of sigma-B (phosphoserine phosphatase) [Texcoconibacillus texcoconensis]
MYQSHTFQHVDVSVHQAAKNGNLCCGDAYYVHETKDYFICAIADGLGSGREAREASEAAIEVVARYSNLQVDRLVQKCNEALVNERGAALMVVKIDYRMNEISYSSIGNITCIFYSPTGAWTHLISTRGYLSGRPRQIPIQYIPFESNVSFILYSDGMLYDPVIHSLMSPVFSTKSTVEVITESVPSGADDVTVMVGKFCL